MFVFHFRLRKRVLAIGAAALAIVLTLALFLPGCSSNGTTEPIAAATEEQRLAYLTSLGWTVENTPIETLDLQLPQKLENDWAAYAALQTEQGLPFAQFTGQQVRRFTYKVTNYPGVEKGVQVNLYVCGEQLIGGDVICTGKNGFQTGLAFPQQEKA